MEQVDEEWKTICTEWKSDHVMIRKQGFGNFLMDS